MRTVEELVARAPDRFDITVIGAAPELQPHTVETIAAGPSQRLFSIDCRVEPGNDERRNAIQIERHMV
jgi:hypothetical protein